MYDLHDLMMSYSRFLAIFVNTTLLLLSECVQPCMNRQWAHLTFVELFELEYLFRNFFADCTYILFPSDLKDV